MAEQQVENTEVQIEQTPPEKKEPNVVEQRALEMGWRPKDDFEGPEEEFIDAAEFVRRRPLFDKIEAQNKQIKQLNKGLEDLKGLYARVKDMEYNRAVATLKTARKEAAKENDYERVDAIETEIERVQTEANNIKQEIVKQNVPQGPLPEFIDWQKKNHWYQKDDGMTLFADALGAKLITKGYSPAEVLTEIDKQVRSEFPHKFRNPNKDQAPTVSESKGATTTSGTMKLDAEQERTMKRFVRLGVMTEKEYIQSIKDLESGQ